MIDFEKVKVGDTIYHMETKYNGTRTKITKVIDGVEWYRYPNEPFEDVPVGYKVRVKVSCTTEGDIREGDYLREMSIKGMLFLEDYDSSVYAYEAVEWYYTEEEAMATVD